MLLTDAVFPPASHCQPPLLHLRLRQIDELTKHNYKMLKSRKDDEVVVRLKKQLDAFKDIMPLLQVGTDT